ncbi:MAG: ATP-binding protein [Gammaproteobacteria bacterium]|nr:ATP-binding protein [Gammaproteobacteria bacterium]
MNDHFLSRFALDALKEWKSQEGGRKPLVLRGARQVGKSCLIRHFAKDSFENLVELNFEENPLLAELFKARSPAEILSMIEIETKETIRPGKTLLFLDEIQAAPEVFLKLRYFFEQIPLLHVIAAGSLLEFLLEEHSFSMPVGRIEYFYLGPLLFEEFLLAVGEHKLCEFLHQITLKDVIPLLIHEKLLRLVRVYLAIGGMPEAVSVYIENAFSYKAADRVHQSILKTYEDDFGKYHKHSHFLKVQKVFQKIPHLVGKKLKYVHIDPEERAKDLSRALQILCLARVIQCVCHTTASGIPLKAMADEKTFKPLFLDVGLMSSACGLSLLEFERSKDLTRVNEGSICEQFVGQHLLYSREIYQEPEIYYWVREKKNAEAEIDYVFSEGEHIIPVEVKSGKTGTLRSLHQFFKDKKRTLGIRFNTDCPSLYEGSLPLLNKESFSFKLISLPVYLVGQTRRIVRQILGDRN